MGERTSTLGCGGEAWGHGGDVLGGESRNAVITDGRAATVVLLAVLTDLETAQHMDDAVDTALCPCGSRAHVVPRARC